MAEVNCKRCGCTVSAERSNKRYCDTCKRQVRREYEERLATDPEWLERKRAKQRERMRQRRIDDPGAVRAAYNKWRAAHPEDAREASRKWAKAHPDKVREMHRAYKDANPDLVRIWNSRCYFNDRESRMARNRAYSDRNRERLIIMHRERTWKRRALLKAADGTFTAQEFEALCLEFEMRCAYCHQTANLLTPDHMIPVARGGSNTIDNIVPACLSCNAAKQARTPLEFIAFPSGFGRMMGTLR